LESNIIGGITNVITMAKVPLGFAASLVDEHISGISKRIPFEGFDF